MATYAHAELSAAELALLAADNPIIAANSASKLGTAAIWATGLAGKIADSDVSETGQPATRAWDGDPGLVTRPNATGTQFTWVCSLGNATVDFVDIAGPYTLLDPD